MALGEKSALFGELTKRPRTTAFIGGTCRTARNVRQRLTSPNVQGAFEPAQPTGNKVLQSFVELVFRIEPIWRLAKQMVMPNNHPAEASNSYWHTGIAHISEHQDPHILSCACCLSLLQVDQAHYILSSIDSLLDPAGKEEDI